MLDKLIILYVGYGLFWFFFACLDYHERGGRTHDGEPGADPRAIFYAPIWPIVVLFWFVRFLYGAWRAAWSRPL